MIGVYALIRSVILAGFVLQIHGSVKVSFELVDFENTGHIELDRGCCDFSCGSCDNRFNLCFDVYGGNNDMTDCAYGNFQTDLLYENNDDFSFPSSLADDLVNPIVLTINSWSTGFRSKIEVWDYDPGNADDRIDYYGYDYTYIPDRTSALATEHNVVLNGAGTSLTRVAVKVYCDVHYYGTSLGCSTYCLARDSSEGHYSCDGITGARVCHSGWQGSYCDLDVNECDLDPCSYGNCTDLVGRYTCDCWPGYSGENCTVNIDECVDNMCQNNSTCQDGVNNYTCSCMSGYTGVYCDTEIDECSSSPCQNGGRCDDSLDSFTCHCGSTGYRGQLCEIDIDECQDEQACPSNKICANVNGSYVCNTKPPEPTPIPRPCLTNVCYNEGTCQIINGSSQCVCTDGFKMSGADDFSGELCETPTGPCFSSPCQNDGSCHVVTEGNGPVYYICQCPEDYVGTTCEIPPQRGTGQGGGFANWYFVLIGIIFIIIC